MIAVSLNNDLRFHSELTTLDLYLNCLPQDCGMNKADLEKVEKLDCNEKIPEKQI